MSPKKSNKVKKPQTMKKEKSLSAFELMQKEEYKRNLKWSLEQCSLEERARMRSEAQSSTNSSTESKVIWSQPNEIPPKDRTPLDVLLKIGTGEMIDPDLEEPTDKNS
jgi:hypothetical protein